MYGSAMFFFPERDERFEIVEYNSFEARAPEAGTLVAAAPI